MDRGHLWATAHRVAQSWTGLKQLSIYRGTANKSPIGYDLGDLEVSPERQSPKLGLQMRVQAPFWRPQKAEVRQAESGKNPLDSVP